MPRAKTHLKAVKDDFIVFERPSDKDCEQAVISGLVFGGVGVFNQYLGVLIEAYFTTPAYRTAFRALVDMKTEGVWAEENQLGSIFLSYIRRQVSASIEEEIMQLTVDIKPGVRFSNLDSYVEQLSEKYKLRKLQDTMFQIWGDMSTDQCRSEQAIKSMRQTVRSLEVLGEASGTRIAGDDLEERMNAMEQLAASGVRYTGIATGISVVDETTLGYQQGDLIIHAGRPSMGKTRITLNDIWQASRLYPAKLFVLKSLEMTKDNIDNQLVAIISGINLARLRCPVDLTKKDWQMIDEARKRLAEYKNIIIDDKKMNVEGIYGSWMRLASRDPIGFFALDYLQMLGGYDLAKYGFNMRLAVGMTADTLKSFAKAEGYPVIAVSTVNRECESQDDKHPEERHLGESDMIGYHADVVKMVYREHRYDKSASVNSAELGIVKQRNGPTGWFGVHYEPTCGRFTNFPSAKDRAMRSKLNQQFLDGEQ